MKIEVEFEIDTQGSVLKNKPREDFHVLMNMKTKALETKEGEKRIPFELACVLDVSGSMSGSKLKWSKRAIRKVIKHMNILDTLHFVTYDSQVKVVFENGDLQNKEELVQKVRNVRTQGCTNISAGIDKAKELLLKSDRKCVKRIFLFSDGEANEGIEDHKEMFAFVKKMQEEYRITVTSFGIGEDFDGRMMEGIGAAGKGSFLYLSEEGNAITSQVSKAIHDMMDLIGTNAILKFKPLNGTKLKKLYDNELDSKTDFQIGDILSANEQQILISMNIDPTQVKILSDEFAILEYSLVYMSKKKSEELTVNGEVSVKITTDEKIASLENVRVRVSRAVQSVGSINGAVMQMMESGKSKEAISLKEDAIKQLESVKRVDESGYVELLLSKEVETLKTMKTSGVRKAKKKARQTHFRAKKKSKRCYSSGDDSDEDVWSEDENDSPPPRRRSQMRKKPVRSRRNISDDDESDDDDDDIYSDES